MKVNPFKIPKKPNEHLLLQIDVSYRFYDKLHQHQEIQLSYVRAGRGKLIIGNQVTTFEAGDLIAIGSNLPHVFLSDGKVKSSHMISLFFTKESFGATFFENQEMKEIEPIWKLLGFGLKVTGENTFIEKIFSNCQNEDKYGLFLNLLILLRFLNRSHKKQLLPSTYTTKISTDQGRRLQQVFDFVVQNFQDEIQLEQAADKVNMTKNSFCRFFKQRTNKTFFQFLAEIRIQHALQLLRENQDLSVIEIAALSGYPTLSNFNRQFKELTHLNPTTYRKQFKNSFKG